MEAIFRQSAASGECCRATKRRARRNSPDASPCLISRLLSAVLPLHGREHQRKPKAEDYGLGFSTEISAPESEVVQAVEDVVNDGIIRGSKEYNKDQYIDKASPAESTPLFPEWKGPGKVYYKVRTGVLAPLNFKESNDQGTLAVRYVVQSKDASKSIVRIDAIFAEDLPPHCPSLDGSVENAESQDIQDHIEAFEAAKKQAEENEKRREAKAACASQGTQERGRGGFHSCGGRELGSKLWTSASMTFVTRRSA